MDARYSYRANGPSDFYIYLDTLDVDVFRSWIGYITNHMCRQLGTVHVQLLATYNYGTMRAYIRTSQEAANQCGTYIHACMFGTIYKTYTVLSYHPSHIPNRSIISESCTHIDRVHIRTSSWWCALRFHKDQSPSDSFGEKEKGNINGTYTHACV